MLGNGRKPDHNDSGIKKEKITVQEESKFCDDDTKKIVVKYL